MKRFEALALVANIAALIMLIGSVLVALVVVPAVEAARPTPILIETPRPTRPTATVTATPSATPTLTPRAISLVTPTGPTATRPPACAPLPAGAALTATPAPVNFRYDLDPALPPWEKSVVLIYRCNGSWVEYLLGPKHTIDNSIYLAAGDVVWSVASVTPAASATPTPTLTSTR